MDAGKLNSLLIFQKRSDGNDGFGNTTAGTGPFIEVTRRYGSVKAARGAEIQQGGQTVGVHTFNIRVRYDQTAALFDNTYQIVIASAAPGPALAVVSVADPDMTCRWLDIVATRGATQ